MHIGLGDDFHERGPRPIVVDERVVGEVRELADVLLEMYAGELYNAVFAHLGGVRPRELDFNAPADAQRLVVLRELVVFGLSG